MNSGLPRTNADSGREENLNSANFKRQGCGRDEMLSVRAPTNGSVIVLAGCSNSGSIFLSFWSESGYGFIKGNHDNINLIFSLQLALYLEQKRKKTRDINLRDKVRF